MVTGPAHTRGTGYTVDEADEDSQVLHPAIQCQHTTRSTPISAFPLKAPWNIRIIKRTYDWKKLPPCHILSYHY